MKWIADRMRRRGQAGLTLMEILLAMGIAAILMVPLGTWAYGTLKAGFISKDELGRSNATGLLNVYFLRDVASARSFGTPAQGITDCTGVPPSNAGVPVLRLNQSGDQPTNVVYVRGTGSDVVPIFRHVCKTTGELVSSTKVMPKVLYASVNTQCADPAGQVAPCDTLGAVRASLSFRQVANDHVKDPITVSGVRRVNTDGTGFSTSNPPDPRLAITPSPKGYTDTVFTVETRSTDPDGDALAVSWTFSDGAGATIVDGDATSGRMSFTMARSGQVIMSVSDGSNTSAGSMFIEVVNRPPIVDSLTPCALVSGRIYSFAATATDPDGTPVAATWTDAGGGVVASSFSATWDAPPGLTGIQTLQLTVSDGSGETAQREVQCDLGGGPPPAGVDITPVAGPTGAINAIQYSELLSVTFTATDPGSSTIDWQLFRKGEATPVNQLSNQTSWELTFGYADRGEYEILRVTDGAAGGRVPFRVNAAPTVSVSSTGAAGEVPARDVEFLASASDPDGIVSGTSWDFGDGTPVLSAPAGAVTHTYTTPGTYTVTFRAVDGDGAVAIATTTVTVPAATPPGGGG